MARQTLTGTFGMLWYQSVETLNPHFDGERFRKEWCRYVGSVHRHFETGELVLCFSTSGPHPAKRQELQRQLESEWSNIGSVLRAIDIKNDEWNRATAAAWQAAEAF